MEPSSKFVKVRCTCKNEQTIFGKAAQPINCLVCGEELAAPLGGKARITAKILEVLE